MTTSRLPNRETFIEWPEFCLVVRKLHGTCQGWKRQDLDARYPQMCTLLLEYPENALGKLLTYPGLPSKRVVEITVKGKLCKNQ